MRIRAKVTLLTLSLIAAVVASVALNLLWLERRRVRSEFAGRVDALMEGVLRIARESVNSKDELMLLSYLKFLTQDYPEIEVAAVSREGHTSLIGVAKSELLYRTVTLTESRSAAYRAGTGAPVPGPAPRAGPARPAPGLPPGTFMVQVGFSKSALERRVRGAQREVAAKIAGIAGAALLLGLAGSLWLGRLLARPVLELASAAEALGEGRLESAVAPRGSDEIAELGRRFNAMAGSLKGAFEAKEDLLSTLAHELNTPLGGLKGFLELLAESSLGPKERSGAYAVMEDTVRQMEASLSNALALFQAGAALEARREPLDLAEVVDEALRLLAPVAKSRGIALDPPAASMASEAARPRGSARSAASMASEAAPPRGNARSAASRVPLQADRELVRRVVVNLVSNALKYTPQGGRVSVALAEEGGSARLSISDTGPGIPAADRERIFEKFYRVGGRSARVPGSGLGLAIAKKAVDLHGGRIWVEPGPGGGSVFHVTLPRAPSGG